MTAPGDAGARARCLKQQSEQDMVAVAPARTRARAAAASVWSRRASNRSDSFLSRVDPAIQAGGPAVEGGLRLHQVLDLEAVVACRSDAREAGMMVRGCSVKLGSDAFSIFREGV
ncbi:hypothetical protein EJB05_54840, partial [Eragrostis curvula]